MIIVAHLVGFVMVSVLLFWAYRRRVRRKRLVRAVLDLINLSRSQRSRPGYFNYDPERPWMHNDRVEMSMRLDELIDAVKYVN